jgi:AraC-like DNA-binding protein
LTNTLQFNLDLWSLALMSGAFQGVLLSLIMFLHTRGRKLANRLLSALILMVSMILAEYVLMSSGFYRNFRYIEFATTPLFFLIGPLFFLYVRSVLDERFTIRSRHLIHGIAFFAVFINYIPYYQLVGHRIFAWGMPSRTCYVDINGYLYMGAHIVFTAAYVYAAFRKLRPGEFAAKREHSNSILVQYDWLVTFSKVFIGFLGVESLALVTMVSLPRHVVELEYLLAATLAAIICIAGYHAIAQPEILSAVRVNGAPSERYRKSALPPEKMESYRIALVRCMESSKPFLNPDMKLQDLADHVSISPNHLSQTLNMELSTTFFDFVNSYRVEEVKQRLKDPAYHHLTILAIALESGFSSKASFNRVFKRHTGVIPSSFLNHREEPIHKTEITSQESTI